MEVSLRPRRLVEGLIEPVCVLGAVDGVGVEEGNVGREVVPGHPRLAAPHPGRGVDSGRVLERETVSGETLDRGVPRPDLGFVRTLKNDIYLVTWLLTFSMYGLAFD